jgi:hypothetical protein
MLALAQFRRDRHALGGAALRLGTAAALCAGLAAVTILPPIALASESARVSLSYGELSKFALSWGDLQYLFRPPKDPYHFDPYHWDLFAGSLVPLLAFAGIFRRAFAARFCAVLAVAVLLFMLHTPVTYVVSEVLPGFGSFKPLSRAAFLLQFALAVLAAYGLQTLIERIEASPRPRLGRASRAGTVLVVVVALSIVVQAWFWKRDVMPHQPDSANYLYPATPLIRDLEAEPVSHFLPTFPTFRGSTPMIYGLRSVGGYESLLPARTQDFWRVLGDRLAPAQLAAQPLIYAYHPAYELPYLQPGLLARASVSHVVAAPPDVETRAVPQRLRLEHAGSDGRLFTVAGALPLAYVVGACEVAETPLAALERFISDDFNPSGRVIVEQPFMRRAGLTCAGGESGRAGTASIVRRSLNSLVVFANARRAGWLVVAESWDEGWSATVDGRRADLLPGDSALRAVPLSPGEHTVRFTYRPPSFELGALVSSLSLGVALGGFGIVVWRRLRS